MTPTDQMPQDVQALLNDAYWRGLLAGYRKGYEGGVRAARAALSTLPATISEEWTALKLQESSATMSLDTVIEDLDLTVRAYNCIKLEGLHTILDVLGRSRAQLAQIRNMGNKAATEVQDKLRAVGYTLREQ